MTNDNEGYLSPDDKKKDSKIIGPCSQNSCEQSNHEKEPLEFKNPINLPNYVDTSKPTTGMDWATVKIMTPHELSMNAIVDPIMDYITYWQAGERDQICGINERPRTSKTYTQKHDEYLPRAFYDKGYRIFIQITPSNDLANASAYCPSNPMSLAKCVNEDEANNDFTVTSYTHKTDKNSSGSSVKVGGKIAYQLDQFGTWITQNVNKTNIADVVVLTITTQSWPKLTKKLEEIAKESIAGGYHDQLKKNIFERVVMINDECDWGNATPDSHPKAKKSGQGYQSPTPGTISESALWNIHRKPQKNTNSPFEDSIIPMEERLHDGILTIMMSGSCSVAQLAKDGLYKNPNTGLIGTYEWHNAGFFKVMYPEGADVKDEGMVRKYHLINKQAPLNINCVIPTTKDTNESDIFPMVNKIIKDTAKYEIKIKKEFSESVFQPKFLTLVQCATDRDQPKTAPIGSLIRGQDDVPYVGISLHNTIEQSSDVTEEMLDQGIIQKLGLRIDSNFSAVFCDKSSDQRYDENKNDHGFHFRDVHGNPQDRLVSATDRNLMLDAFSDPNHPVRVAYFQDAYNRGHSPTCAVNFVCGRAYHPDKDYAKAVSPYIQGPGRPITQKIMVDYSPEHNSYAIEWRYKNDLDLMYANVYTDYGITTDRLTEYIKATSMANIYLLSRPNYEIDENNPVVKGLIDFSSQMVNPIADYHLYLDALNSKYRKERIICPRCNGTGYLIV